MTRKAIIKLILDEKKYPTAKCTHAGLRLKECVRRMK